MPLSVKGEGELYGKPGALRMPSNWLNNPLKVIFLGWQSGSSDRGFEACVQTLVPLLPKQNIPLKVIFLILEIKKSNL
jgi:hypothetical protein